MHQLISVFFSVEISVKKVAPADSRRKGDADFLIKGMGLAPLDQRVFFRVDQREKSGSR